MSPQTTLYGYCSRERRTTTVTGFGFARLDLGLKALEPRENLVEAPGIEDGRQERRSGIDGWIFHRGAIGERGADGGSGMQRRWAGQGAA